MSTGTTLPQSDRLDHPALPRSTIISQSPTFALQVYDAIRDNELMAIADSTALGGSSSSSASAPRPPPPFPAAANASSPRAMPSAFGTNVAVDPSRKRGTFTYTLTSRTHAHVMRNLTQGVAAVVQVGVPLAGERASPMKASPVALSVLPRASWLAGGVMVPHAHFLIYCFCRLYLHWAPEAICIPCVFACRSLCRALPIASTCACTACAWSRWRTATCRCLWRTRAQRWAWRGNPGALSASREQVLCP